MEIDKFIRGNILHIKVKPKARETKITGIDGDKVLVDVAAVPEKNKANQEIVKFFKKLTKKEVKIKSGLTSREKTLIIT